MSVNVYISLQTAALTSMQDNGLMGGLVRCTTVSGLTRRSTYSNLSTDKWPSLWKDFPYRHVYRIRSQPCRLDRRHLRYRMLLRRDCLQYLWSARLLFCGSRSTDTRMIGERLGRRKSIFIGVVIMIIGALLQATAYTSAHLVVARIVSGVGMGLINSTVPVLMVHQLPSPSVESMLTVMKGGVRA